MRVPESYTLPGGQEVRDGTTTVTVVVLVIVRINVVITVALANRVVVIKLTTVFVGGFVISFVLGNVIVTGIVDVKVIIVVVGSIDVVIVLVV